MQHENLDSLLFLAGFLSCGHTSKGFFLHIILKCFCKFLMVISIWGVGVSFGHVMVIHDENLDFVLCFQLFPSVGVSRKGVLLGFFILLVKFMSGEHVASICSRLALFRHSRRETVVSCCCL